MAIITDATTACGQPDFDPVTIVEAWILEKGRMTPTRETSLRAALLEYVVAVIDKETNRDRALEQHHSGRVRNSYERLRDLDANIKVEDDLIDILFVHAATIQPHLEKSLNAR